MDWTIGTDIEMMLEKAGKLVSAVPILGNDGVSLPHGQIFYDNVLAEFTVNPSSSRKSFIKTIRENLDAATALFAKNDIVYRVISSARYPMTELQSDAAKLFGCSPDYDAYSLTVNEVAQSAEETDLRSAGGHIHFGHSIFGDPYKVVDMIKLMDLYLGVPSVLKDNTPEAKERRVLYGKAGAHRPRDYPGGEYRSLSNWWIRNDDSIGWVYDQTERCLDHLLSGNTVQSLGFDELEIQRVINEGDEVVAGTFTSQLV
jgi:hypothetical protein